MYSRLQLARKYLEYYRKASNSKGHGIHSPFIFNLVKNVLGNHTLYDEYKQVELFRHLVLSDYSVIEVEDLGAGSATLKSSKRKIADIAKHSVKPRKYGQLLFRLAKYYQPHTIIELGTSLGITTAYLALANKNSSVITVEGAWSIAAAAKQNFNRLNINNIKLVEGNFDIVLPQIVDNVESVDMAFVDGNHREQATLNYFLLLVKKVNPSSILVFDDIHWSAGMEEAWEIIKGHPTVKTTVDLFSMGLVFFKEEFKIRQHFTIRY